MKTDGDSSPSLSDRPEFFPHQIFTIDLCPFITGSTVAP